MLAGAFILQVLLALAAAVTAPRIARCSKPVWLSVAIAAMAVIVCWPLMRVFAQQAIELFGVLPVVCTELTAMIVPAALFFGIVARHTPRKRDGRALHWLTALVAVYFIKAGWWMIWPTVGAVGPTQVDASGVCHQTTGYTCVAASLVTMLRARGISAEELEMAKLSYTEVGAGATDSRALLALETKLAGAGLRAGYRRLDEASLIAAPKPCMVQLDWGFFVSHMVPVMAATPQSVTIGDPLSGPRVMPMRDFLRDWKRMAITIEPVAQ